MVPPVVMGEPIGTSALKDFNQIDLTAATLSLMQGHYSQQSLRKEPPDGEEEQRREERRGRMEEQEEEQEEEQDQNEEDEMSDE